MKYTLPLVTAAVLTLFAACGGGGGGGAAVAPVDQTPPVVIPPVTPERPDFLTLADHCAVPRRGLQPSGLPYYDLQGTLTEEMRWVRSFIEEGYLWYKEVPGNLNMADYKTVLDYFAVLKTPLITASGRPKDRFHFTYPSEVWEEMSNSGVTLGYGVTWSRSTDATPRVWIVTLVEPESPADVAGLRRGDVLLTVDGVDVNDTGVDAVATRTAGLAPAKVGETHQFVLRRGAATVSVALVSKKIAGAAVRNVRVIDTATGPMGYLQFNEHNAVAEGQLVSAFNTLRAAQVNDLVLDMRYNGGGYLVVAAELAYMIAGPDASNGKVFERLQPNDKRPPQIPQMFQAKSVGLAPKVIASGVELPYLGLKRVTILTTPGTCSASESVINSLRGIDVQVNLIGGETCGKPYAFVPQSNCGTTYFAIQTQGTNDKGFGDYADGFQPTCRVDDDFDHALGDSAERLLATAMSYRANGVCPAAPLRARSLNARGPLQLVRPEGKEIAIHHR